MVYWGSPNIAHTMVSFGFEGGDYLCFSIETRKEKGEGYSAVKGLFRQFELIYVAADERDVVRLRTNYRQGEEAYLFRLNGSPEQVRTLFLDYLRRLNSLRQRPEWYSALTHNCTTSIRMQRAAADRAPWDWRMLANGHGDELLYERGLIATNLPLAELKQRVPHQRASPGGGQSRGFLTTDPPGIARNSSYELAANIMRAGVPWRFVSARHVSSPGWAASLRHGPGARGRAPRAVAPRRSAPTA